MVHFKAPPVNLVAGEMARLVEWFNRVEHNDLVLKLAVAHLLFVTIHPFEDGNGTIARGIMKKAEEAGGRSTNYELI
jgi:Fic family protein